MDEATLSARAALLAALIGELRADAALMNRASGGVWSVKPQPGGEAQTVVRLKSDKRTSTFGGEAFRTLHFDVAAYWGDDDGANYLNGEAMLERARFLLDGGQSRQSAARVRAALTPRLEFHGWKLLGMAEVEDNGGDKDEDEPESQVVGQDESNPLFSMGCRFIARLKRIEP